MERCKADKNFVLPKIVQIKIIAQICNSNSGRLEATRLEFGWASTICVILLVVKKEFLLMLLKL